MSKAPPQRPDEEGGSARRDDRIIGPAARRSLIALALLLALLVGAVIVFKTTPAIMAGTGALTKYSAPVSPRASAKWTSPPSDSLTSAAESGITFVHNNGAYGEKSPARNHGWWRGVFFDYDNDGNQDLLFVNSTDWPWHAGGTGADNPGPLP